MYSNVDHFILADQSSGHTRKRIDGCDITKINTCYGGAQSAITNSVVRSNDYGQSNIEGRHEFAINFEHSFPKLDKYSKNNGPYWMSKEIRLKTKEDVIDGTLKEKDNSKDNLLLELQQFLVPNKIYTKEFLKNIANENNISLKESTACCPWMGWIANEIIP